MRQKRGLGKVKLLENPLLERRPTLKPGKKEGGTQRYVCREGLGTITF